MIYEIFENLKYNDFMIVEDYIDELMREDDLISVKQVDYVQKLFYQFKERYDVFYCCNFNIESDVSGFLLELFMEYSYCVFKKIENTLSLLIKELKYSPIFARIMEKVHDLAKTIKIRILSNNPDLIFLF